MAGLKKPKDPELESKWPKDVKSEAQSKVEEELRKQIADLQREKQERAKLLNQKQEKRNEKRIEMKLIVSEVSFRVRNYFLN